MPLINRLPPLTLSFRRADVIAFWLVATSAAMVVGSLVAIRLGAQPWVWGPAAAVALAAPGLWWREWFDGGITTWNSFVRALTSALRVYVLAVTYYVLFAALARAGSSLDISSERPLASKWLPVPHDTNLQTHGAALASPGAAAHQNIRAWVQTPGRMWALCVIPITVLLRVLSVEQQDTAPPTSTYTLY